MITLSHQKYYFQLAPAVVFVIALSIKYDHGKYIKFEGRK